MELQHSDSNHGLQKHAEEMMRRYFYKISAKSFTHDPKGATLHHHVPVGVLRGEGRHEISYTENAKHANVKPANVKRKERAIPNVGSNFSFETKAGRRSVPIEIVMHSPHLLFFALFHIPSILHILSTGMVLFYSLLRSTADSRCSVALEG